MPEFERDHRRIDRAHAAGGMRPREIEISSSVDLQTAAGVTYRLGYDQRLVFQVDTSSAAVTISLPDMYTWDHARGTEMIFRTSSGANPCHVEATTNGGRLINGVAGFSLLAAGDYATVFLRPNGNFYRIP